MITRNSTLYNFSLFSISLFSIVMAQENKNNDKNTVLSLREIAEGKISI